MELIYLYVKSYKNKNQINLETSSGNKDFSIKETSFNFSDSFNCSFDKEEGLKIENVNHIFPNFYGHGIKSVKVLAGRNGSGKTTILDLIGMTRGERCEDHLFKDNDNTYFTSEYFFIYHMKDNEFLIELVGNMIDVEDCWIKNLDLDSVYSKGKNMHYKLPIGYVFNYDFDKNKMKATYKHCFSNYSFENSKERIITDHANIYYFSNSSSHRRTSGIKNEPRQNKDSDYLIKRQSLEYEINEPNDYHAIYKILFSEKYKEFISNTINTSLTIQIKDSYSDSIFLNRIFADKDRNKALLEELQFEVTRFARELYRNNGLPYKGILNKKDDEVESKYNSKQKYLLGLSYRYILHSLESLINIVCKDSSSDLVRKTDSNLSDVDIQDYLNDIKKGEYKLYEAKSNAFEEFFDFKKITNILYDKAEISIGTHLSVSSQIFKKCDNIDLFHENIINNIILGRYLLMRIKSQMKSGKDTMYQESFEEVIIQLLKLDDNYFNNNGIIIKSKFHDEDSNINDLFKIVNKWYQCDSDYNNDIWDKFNIRIPYSSDGEGYILNIFSKFINVLENEERSLHVILMDEPDQGLHPEWSRQFIKLIVDTIEALDKSNYMTQDKKLNVQLIISTHSPFILSDIRSEDLLILDHDSNNKLLINGERMDTFSANIHDILNKSFFLDDTVGEFAKNKIASSCSRIFNYKKREFIAALRNEEITHRDLDKLGYLIKQISEPIIKNLLTKELDTRNKWMCESDMSAFADYEVDDVFIGFSKLSSNKKKKFVQKLLASERGGSYD